MKRLMLAALIGSLVLAGVLIQRRGYSDREHERFQSALWRLKHLDATFDQDVLRARFSLLENYDNFQRILLDMERHTAVDLHAPPRFVSDAGRAEIDRFAAQLARLLEERRILFERFKSRNAILANSRRYFPIALEELGQRLGDSGPDRELAVILQELTRVLLANAASGDEQPSTALPAPTRLQDWSTRHSGHAEAAFVASMVRHAHELLAGKNELDEITRRLLALPADRAIERLSRLYEDELTDALRSTQRYRMLLYALGALLLAAVGYALWTQREANHHLERRVTERTAQLQGEMDERRKSDEARRASQSFLRSLVENAPVQIFRKDCSGRLTFANKLLCDSLGRQPSEVIGLTAAELLSPAEAERQRLTDERVTSTGQTYDAIEEREGQGGKREFFHLIEVPIFDESGACVGVQGMSLDVTAQEEAERKIAYERDQLRALLDSSPDTIYFKDLESRFVLVSRSKVLSALDRVPDLRARRTARGLAADVPEAELLNGLSDFDTYQDDDAHLAFEDEQQIVRSGEPIIGKIEKQIYADGVVRWRATSKMPWRDRHGTIIGTFGISKDITELKEAEEKLAQLHRQLLDASRQAGMAEVATGVLHNVGNVLNSVNVSATLVADQVRHSKSANLTKLAALFDQNKADLAQFLTRDSRGQLVPGYIGTLAEMVASERASLLNELDQLRANIEHIKEIVAMQQAYARTSGVIETVSVPDMVEDALRMNAGSLARHDVETQRDYQARPVVTTDKHKVIQILINLVRNAKYACDESGRTDKQIVVRTTADDCGVKIAVCDNGIGIPGENLLRIFNHGFTTRKNGHGFGLHSGSLAAKELGGSLTATSEGPGRGATFLLELPYTKETS